VRGRDSMKIKGSRRAKKTLEKHNPGFMSKKLRGNQKL
jgi:hypothetical protein